MTRPSIVVSALAMAAAVALPSVARAQASFVLEVVDPAGTGFNDPAPASPVGGNMGTTVGEQRRIAFEHALSIWGRVLESDVEIVVEASFAPLTCSGGFAVLGQAGPAGVELDYPGLEPDVLYPAALADQILGEDLTPGAPDIQAMFNGGLQECFGGDFDWYYGLDARTPANRADLVSTVLHEIAHGLGFLTMVEIETGAEALPGYTDPYTMRLLDTQTGTHWPDMSNGERAASARRVRQLVWDGRFGNEAAASALALGAPSLKATPAVTGLRDAVVDANFGSSLVDQTVSGSVALASPADGCEEVTGVAGRIALVLEGACNVLDKAYFAETAGATALLIAYAAAPPPTIDQRQEFVTEFPVGIPVLGVPEDDATLLLGATTSTIELSADGARRIGTDAMGRLHMYATAADLSSGVSHFDPMARPDLTMEPAESPNVSHDIKVDRALLRDIGWVTSCGNGQLDEAEECDSGAANSDVTPDACRLDCRRARCGDGVVDSGEQCDVVGGSNQCSSLCRPHECGDGVVGPGERCDDGAANSATQPDACRPGCTTATCGDGVVDSGEVCDDALSPGACVDCAPVTGTGGGSGAAGTGGTPPGGGGNAGSAGNAGTAGASGGVAVAASDAGCGCSTPGLASRSGSVVPLLLALGWLRRRIRRAG